MSSETSVEAVKTKTELECEVLGEGARDRGVDLDNMRARVQVLESVMRQYALRGHWQGNKEGFDESWIERDFGELARKVMGGEVLIPLDEAAKRDAEIERMRSGAVRAIGLHVREIVEKDEKITRLKCDIGKFEEALLEAGDALVREETEHEKFFMKHLQELADLIGLRKPMEGTEYGGAAISKGIVARTKELEHYKERLLDEISACGKAEEMIEEMRKRSSDAVQGLADKMNLPELLGVPPLGPNAQWGMGAIREGIDKLMNELNAFVSAVEAERLRLIEREAVVAGSPQELNIRKCDGDSVHEVANVWYGHGLKG